jgi:hypothetical protein
MDLGSEKLGSEKLGSEKPRFEKCVEEYSKKISIKEARKACYNTLPEEYGKPVAHQALLDVESWFGPLGKDALFAIVCKARCKVRSKGEKAQ